jgi:hypothetical protein
VCAWYRMCAVFGGEVVLPMQTVDQSPCPSPRVSLAHAHVDVGHPTKELFVVLPPDVLDGLVKRASLRRQQGQRALVPFPSRELPAGNAAAAAAATRLLRGHGGANDAVAAAARGGPRCASSRDWADAAVEGLVGGAAAVAEQKDGQSSAQEEERSHGLLSRCVYMWGGGGKGLGFGGVCVCG